MWKRNLQRFSVQSAQSSHNSQIVIEHFKQTRHEVVCFKSKFLIFFCFVLEIGCILRQLIQQCPYPLLIKFFKQVLCPDFCLTSVSEYLVDFQIVLFFPFSSCIFACLIMLFECHTLCIKVLQFVGLNVVTFQNSIFFFVVVVPEGS